MLTAREIGEARESGPGSAQSAGMQEGAGERRRVQASHWKLRKPGFHRPGREQAYQRHCHCRHLQALGAGAIAAVVTAALGFGWCHRRHRLEDPGMASLSPH